MRRQVWLPSLRVWAQAQEPLEAELAASASTSCQSLESSEHYASATPCFKEAGKSTETLKHKYRRGRTHSAACDDKRDRQEHHRSRRDVTQRDSRSHLKACCPGSYRDLHNEPNHACPICLSPISQASLTVLRWCMHRFCLACIEKWSHLQRFCPLCKQTFHGWYYNIESPLVFDKKDLAAVSSSQASTQSRTWARRERYPVPRERTALSVRRSKALPWRRKFRYPSTTTLAEKDMESKAEESALQWRASVYRKNLRAVPPHLNASVKIREAPANDPERKARIERRLEPWVRRELHAIMGDPNPSLLVHLVQALWLHALSEREKIADNRNLEIQLNSRNPEIQQNRGCIDTLAWDLEAIKQLEPFLHAKASAFWHELRCFAESPFTLRTYDSIIGYEKCGGSLV